MNNFTFCHTVFNSIILAYSNLKRLSLFLHRCFRSHLFQIGCMWERGNNVQMDILLCNINSFQNRVSLHNLCLKVGFQIHKSFYKRVTLV